MFVSCSCLTAQHTRRPPLTFMRIRKKIYQIMRASEMSIQVDPQPILQNNQTYTHFAISIFSIQYQKSMKSTLMAVVAALLLITSTALRIQQANHEAQIINALSSNDIQSLLDNNNNARLGVVLFCSANYALCKNTLIPYGEQLSNRWGVPLAKVDAVASPYLMGSYGIRQFPYAVVVGGQWNNVLWGTIIGYASSLEDVFNMARSYQV